MMHYVSDSQSVVHRPAASAVTWELAANAHSWPHPRPTQSEILEWASAICVLTIPPGDADAARVLKIIALWAQLLFPLPAALCKVASILNSSLADPVFLSNSTVAFTCCSKTWSLNSHLGALHRCHSVFPLCQGYCVATVTCQSADGDVLLSLSANWALIYPSGPLPPILNRCQWSDRAPFHISGR